jgi:hypothetical protein
MTQRRTALLAVSLLNGLLLAACEQAQPTDPNGEAPDGLVVTTNTPDQVAGSIRAGQRVVSFESDTSKGNLRVAVYGMGKTPLYAMSTAGTNVSVDVMGRLQSTFDPNQVTPSGDMSAGAMLMTGDATAWQTLFLRPEAYLLNNLPDAIRNAGIKGEDSPAARGLQQVLGQLALMSSKLAVLPAAGSPQDGVDLSSQPLASDSQCARLKCSAGMQKVHVTPTSSSCTCRQPAGPQPPCRPEYPGDLHCDPNHDDCLGMCGPGCACDTIYCGDCKFHEGCYTHDLACKTCTDNWVIGAPSACAICASPIGLAIALTCRL